MMSTKTARSILGLGLALAIGFAIAPAVTSAQDLRQYYGSTWSYSPANSYYYVNYYYRPVPTQTTYNYHYCIYYPSQANYIYYY